MAFGSVIAELIDAGAELDPSLLGRLSGLGPEERDELRGRWATIPARRREEIVGEIVRMADDDIELDFLPVLCVALQDAEPAVRARAASGFWETGDRTVIRPLVGLIEDDASDEVRAAAATALGHFVDLAEAGKLIERDVCRVREALRATLENGDEAPSVRRRALEALAPMRGCGVEEWIGWAYRSDDVLVRQSAVYAMGRTCDPAWLSVVLDEMESAGPGDALRGGQRRAPSWPIRRRWPRCTRWSTMRTRRWRWRRSTPSAASGGRRRGRCCSTTGTARTGPWPRPRPRRCAGCGRTSRTSR